ncbi:Stress response protein nst1 [Dispira parvispora]|uniref:Stress response protein NST1 n=1 Tax=Dispira parvispora TaxID=1520584 RepID=A0A9W8AVM2_9FUNG|nr:Stress response protein nst1 [Dispira parvispora]
MVQPRSSVRQGNPLPNPSPLSKGGFSSHHRPSPCSWFAEHDTDTPSLSHHEEWSSQDGSTTDDSATLSPEIVSITQIGPRATNTMRRPLTGPLQATTSCDECCSDDSDLYIAEVTGGVEQPVAACRCGRDSMSHTVPVKGGLPVATQPPAATLLQDTPSRPNRPRESTARPVNGTAEATALRPPQGVGSSDNSTFASSSDPFPSVPQAMAPQPPPGVHPSPLAHRPSYHHDRFLVAPTVPKLSYEERERVRQYWHALSLSQKLALLRMGKNEVAKAIRTQRKLSCTCSLCGRRRHKVETQLQDFYEAYHSSLINLVQARQVSPGKSNQTNPVRQTTAVAENYPSPASITKDTAPKPKPLRKHSPSSTRGGQSPSANPSPGPPGTLPSHGVCPDCTSEIPPGPAAVTSSVPNTNDNPASRGTPLPTEDSSTVTTVFPYGISHHPFYCYTSSDEEEDYPEECGPGCDSCATVPHRLAPGTTRPRLATRELPTAGDFPSRPPNACPYECDETYVEELDDEYFDYLYGQQHGGNPVPLPYQANPHTSCELCTPNQPCPTHQPASGPPHELEQDTGEGQDSQANFYIDPKWIANVIRNLRLQVQESIHKHHESDVAQPSNPLVASPGQSAAVATPSSASSAGIAFGPSLPSVKERTGTPEQDKTGEPATFSRFLYNSSHVGRSHTERAGHLEVTEEMGAHADFASATPGQEPDWSLSELAEVDGELSTASLEISGTSETRTSKNQLDLLRVAEDLFNNDGKRFLAMMEQYAKHRLQSESQRQQPSTLTSTTAVDYDEGNCDDDPTEDGPESTSPSATHPATDDTTSTLFASAASALSAGNSFFRSLSKEKKELSLIMAESIATWFVDKKLMGRTARSVAHTDPPSDTAYPDTDQAYPWLETEFPLPPVETLNRSFPETLEQPDGSLGGGPSAQAPVTTSRGEEPSLVDDQVYDADLGYDHDYVDEEDDDFERANNAVDLLANEEQQLEEARHAFQLLMTCLLENRVITSYREQVAQEKANELLRELDQDKKGKSGHSSGAKRKKPKEKRKPKKKSQREIQMEKEREAKERKRQQEEERQERETERERQRAQERKEREKVERKRQEVEAQKRLAQLQKERALHAKPNPVEAPRSGRAPSGDQPAKGSPGGRGEDSTSQAKRTESNANSKVRKPAPTHLASGTAAHKASVDSPTGRAPRHASEKTDKPVTSPVMDTRSSATPRDSTSSGPVDSSLRSGAIGQSSREAVVTSPNSRRRRQKPTLSAEPAATPAPSIPTSVPYPATSVAQDAHLVQSPTTAASVGKESAESTSPLHTPYTIHPINLNPAPISHPPALINTLMATEPYDPSPRSAPVTHFPPTSMTPGLHQHFSIPQYTDQPGLAPGSSTTLSQVSSQLPSRDLTDKLLSQPFFNNLPRHHNMASSVDTLRPSPVAPRHSSASLGYDSLPSSSLLSRASPSHPTDLPSLLVEDLLEDDSSDLTEAGLGTSSLDFFNRVHPQLLPNKTPVSRPETGFRGASLTVPSLSSLDYTSSSIWSPTVPPASATNLSFAPGRNRTMEPLRRHSSSFSAAFAPQISRPMHPNPSPLEARIPMDRRAATTGYSTAGFPGSSSGSNGGPVLPSHQTDLLNQLRLGNNSSYGSSLPSPLAQHSNQLSHILTSESSRRRHISDTARDDLLKPSSNMSLEAIQRQLAPGS